MSDFNVFEVLKNSIFFFFGYVLMFRGQAEKEFRAEVEAVGHVRHKNLVRLLGYCLEGIHKYTSL